MTPERWERVQELYREYDVAIVFAATLTPIPYKVITNTAGVFGLILVAQPRKSEQNYAHEQNPL